MKIEDKLIRDFEDYLKSFIHRFQYHSHLSLLDISQHLNVVKEFNKELKKCQEVEEKAP